MIHVNDLAEKAMFYADWKDLQSVRIIGTDNDNKYTLFARFKEKPFTEIEIKYFSLKKTGLHDIHNNIVNSLVVYSKHLKLKHNITYVIQNKEDKKGTSSIHYYIAKDLNKIFGKGLYKFNNGLHNPHKQIKNKKNVTWAHTLTLE